MLLNPLDLLPIEAQDAVVNKKPESYDSGLKSESGQDVSGKSILTSPALSCNNGVGMSPRFIKFIPSEEALFLLKKKGHAFRLLTIIAESARRYEGGPDGLKIGEALIGGFENYDMTERNYRTAKQLLVKRRHIEIIETCRTRKKSTTGSTTVGTKVKLLSSSVWDINLDEGDDRSDERPTTERRPSDDKLRKIKKDKKDKKKTTPTPSFSDLPQKIKFREFVELTQSEYDSLASQHGKEFLEQMLDTLDAYKGSSGRKYDSDFHTMKQGGWVVKRVKDDLLQPRKPNAKPAKYNPAPATTAKRRAGELIDEGV